MGVSYSWLACLFVAWICKLWVVLVMWWKCQWLGCVMCWLWCGLVRRHWSLIFTEMWCVMIIFASSLRYQLSLLTILYPCLGLNWLQKTLWGKFMIGWKKKDIFNCEFTSYISIGWMRRAYLRSSLFYSFCYKSSFRQHRVNVTFFKWCFYLFIPFTGELFWNVFVNQERFLLYNKHNPSLHVASLPLHSP